MHTAKKTKAQLRPAAEMTLAQQRQEWLYPEKCSTALERWDKDETIFTVEMGGIGPGYEQAIQALVFEIIRDHHTAPVPDFMAMKEPKKTKAWRQWADATISRCDKNYGFSGAQVGAAKSLAYRALRDGWGKSIQSAPDDRRIQVSKHFPTVPEVKPSPPSVPPCLCGESGFKSQISNLK